ncbi:zf-HC2 domain-containing protein [Roseateles sp. DXS20W]|uniref:Zf-HC2 domain-containing protein n=1 Tax=Pelomonas lactea TaxID=3299030 RepID=A0ABW7GK46_9BURK
MSVVIPMEHDEHAAVQALLPWFARGQLDEADMAKVQQHLPHCVLCRNELAAERPMQTLLAGAGAPEDVGDVEAGLAKLHARLLPVARQPAAPRWVPWALGAQGAACALLLGLWLQARQDAPAYEGLSAAGTVPVAADALVMFKPGTGEQALRELLQAQGASVVAGPTETGAWLLRVDARGLAALRAAPIVQLAEPLQPGPAR